jgi:uncharacterized protein
LTILAGTAQAAEPLVEDGAGLMAPAEREALAEYHGYLIQDHDIDYRVVTASQVGDINLFALSRFEELAPETRSITGRMLLLAVDPEQDLVRLEVGQALEGVFTDGFIAYVEHRQMVPFFRAGRVADGILATTELIVMRAQRAAANAGFEDEAWAARSGGAGATAPADLNAGPAARSSPAGPRPSAGTTPGATLRAYFMAMDSRDDDPDLAIFTPATRDMLQGWVVTPAQMDSLVKSYRRCHPEPARFGPGAALAVIRYPVPERACAPFFFQKLDGAWVLDLTMMQSAIRFGRTNAWRFLPGAAHPYQFAFEDWRFDPNGFPLAGR